MFLLAPLTTVYREKCDIQSSEKLVAANIRGERRRDIAISHVFTRVSLATSLLSYLERTFPLNFKLLNYATVIILRNTSKS